METFKSIKNKKAVPLILFSLALIVSVAGGRWAQSLFLASEFVHFSVNFPTEPGYEIQSRQDLGGPWAMLDDSEWDGYPAGGLLVFGREGEITIDVGRQGIIKRLFQPRDVTLSSHWLRNISARPYWIKLDLDMCGIPIEWETFERHWDYRTRTATREILPGKLFNMDWHFQLPEGWESRSVICDGGLKVIDAEDGALLTLLPIRIVNSAAGK